MNRGARSILRSDFRQATGGAGDTRRARAGVGYSRCATDSSADGRKSYHIRNESNSIPRGAKKERISGTNRLVLFEVEWTERIPCKIRSETVDKAGYRAEKRLFQGPRPPKRIKTSVFSRKKLQHHLQPTKIRNRPGNIRPGHRPDRHENGTIIGHAILTWDRGPELIDAFSRSESRKARITAELLRSY